MKRDAALVLGLLLVGSMYAQAPAAHHEANFDSERKQADQMFLKGDKLQALPLYTDLRRQDPTIAIFAERRASGLIAAADVEDDPTKKDALHDEGITELRRARQLGDNSDLVEHILGLEDERLASLANSKASNRPANANAKPPAAYVSQDPKVQALMHDAETAFAKNDTKTAFEDYRKASEIDPNFYLAKLYTGDACFRANDYPCAEAWFEKAVAVDPTIETAYRYWGDALFRSGHPKEARRKYEEAIVANPYTRASWSGLQQWGAAVKTQIGSPAIQRATVVRDAGGTKVTLPQGSAEDTKAWTLYAMCRAEEDHHRAAGVPRTAAEELKCLDLAADSAAKAAPGTVGPGLQSLLALKRTGMVECWLLLNGPDQDILHEYPAYRQAHRELLIAYLDNFVIHDGIATTGRSTLQTQP